MRRTRKTDPIQDTLIITTPDGTRLRCSLSTVGREDEPRWMILTADGSQYVGPIAESDRSAEAVQRLIETWWESHVNTPR